MDETDNRATTRCQAVLRCQGPIEWFNALPRDNMSPMAEETLNDRVWYAFHCLPRVRGKPPAATAVETEHAISRGTLSRLFKGDKKTVDSSTLVKLSKALGVTMEWLTSGVGERPKLTGAMRPRDERHAELDPSTWVAKSIAAGGLTIPTNNFQAAVATLFNQISVETIRIVGEEAIGHENERPAHHWGGRLHEVELAQSGRERPKAQPAKPKKEPKASKAAPQLERAKKAS